MSNCVERVSEETVLHILQGPTENRHGEWVPWINIIIIIIIIIIKNQTTILLRGR